MGLDWIKMRTDLYRDPKVCVMADILMDPSKDLGRYVDQNCQCEMAVTRNVMRNAVCGALISVWGVIRHQGHRNGDDLVVSGVTLSVVDDIADLPGFGYAMWQAGWVNDEQQEGLIFPKFFGDKNVDPAEESAKKNADRQKKFREARKQSNENSNVTRNVTVTHREEKRREEIEKSINTHTEPQTEQLKQQATEDSLTAHQLVVDTFNTVAQLKARLTPKRRKTIATRLRDKSWDYVAACEKIPESTFLNGGGKDGWKITFDWFLKPDSVTRILEGEFPNEKSGGQQFVNYTPPTAGANEDVEGF